MSSNTIKIKAGSGTPTTSDIQDKELAFDRSADKLYINDAGSIVDLTGSASSGDIEGVTAGTGLSGGGSSGTVSLAVDLSELTDMTASVNSSEDELIILDNGADRRKLISEIPLSAFNNDSGFITSTLTTEAVQDIVGAMFTSNTETRISATYQDGDGTIDLVVDDMTADTNTQLSTEQVQDIVGAMFTGNTETRITATYQDADGTIDLVVDDLDTDTQLTTENVQDIVGAMFSSNTETRISATYQDGDGTIDLVVDDMTANDNTVTTNIAGTGIDVSSGTGNSTISVDVSDFMANGSNNRIVTATGTDAMNAEANLTFNGSTLTLTGEFHPSSHIDMPDDARIKLGASDDLQIVHTSGINFIHSTSSNTDVYFRVNDGGTDTDAIIIDSSESARVRIPNDGQRLSFGADQDMQLSHESNNNYIATYAGNLIFEQNTNDADIVFNCDDGSGGVTAYLTLDGSETCVNIEQDVKLTAAKKLYLDGGGNSYIQEESADNLIFRAAGGNYLRVTGSNIVLNDPGASYDVRIEGDADSNLFFTDGSADKVGIGTNSPDTKLDITASGVNGLVINQDEANADISSRLFFKEQNSTIALYNIGDTFSFRTGATINSTSGTERMHIDTNGIDVNGSVIADSLDISGDVDIDGTTNLDAVDIDGVITAADGSASNPQYSFGADTNSGMFRVSSDVVGIAAAGNSRFTVKGNGIKAPNGSLGVNTDPNSTDGMIHATNDIVAFSSDKRLKENIRPIENALDKVSKLSGFVFNWNELANEKAEYNMDKDYVGVYAQDVEEVQPEAVDLAPFDNDGEDNSISGEKYLTVQYEKLVPLLIEAIKQLKEEVEELKK